METDYSGVRFCRECGAAIPDGSDFCYACGAMAPAPASRPAAAYTENQGLQPDDFQALQESIARAYIPALENVAGTLARFILIWAVIALFFGIVSVFYGNLFPQEISLLSQYGVSLSALSEAGMFLTASGAAALVTVLLLKKLRAFWLCVMLCLASAILSYPGMGGFSGILTAFAGAYMALGIYRCRRAFKS